MIHSKLLRNRNLKNRTCDWFEVLSIKIKTVQIQKHLILFRFRLQPSGAILKESYCMAVWYGPYTGGYA